ncbi:AraC family transcriptional regulator [Klebsiella pneumoniae]|uniref:AraC family transcriptional regulator n=1 Tax=Klebsiella pneumoniae TaxID=573 RepID=UPI003076757B
MNHTRDIPQTFWRDDRLPWLELRSTWRSRRAYKRHSHPQLSVGAIIEGETRCLCAGQEYLLQPGDLIVIPPHALPLCAAAPQAPHHASALLFQRLAMDLPASPSLDKLAHDSALRKETVIRAVKQDTGLTPASLINMARIEYAKTRLRAGDPIADVGYQAGFADQSHFHKTFVSYTAATPLQYAQSRSISDNK